MWVITRLDSIILWIYVTVEMNPWRICEKNLVQRTETAVCKAQKPITEFNSFCVINNVVAQFSHHPHLPDLSTPTISISKIKIGLKGDRFDRSHPEICSHEIKNVPNFWLCTSYETVWRSRQRVYSSVRRLSRIKYYWFQFFAFFPAFSQCCCKTY